MRPGACNRAPLLFREKAAIILGVTPTVESLDLGGISLASGNPCSWQGPMGHGIENTDLACNT